MLITSSHRKRNDQQFLQIVSQPLKRVSQINILGLTVNQRLKFDAHIDSVIVRARRMLAFSRRATRCAGADALPKLDPALVRPQLEYCTPICFPHQETRVARSQSLQGGPTHSCLQSLINSRGTLCSSLEAPVFVA